MVADNSIRADWNPPGRIVLLAVCSIDRGEHPDRDRRVVFFDGRNTIFENHEDIFTFLPHNEIRNVAAFFFDDDFAVE